MKAVNPNPAPMARLEAAPVPATWERLAASVVLDAIYGGIANAARDGDGDARQLLVVAYTREAIARARAAGVSVDLVSKRGQDSAELLVARLLAASHARYLAREAVRGGARS